MNELQKFLKEALTGLRLPQKSLPCKYFYDARGSELFESICELEEYYPTRIELSIMKEYAKEMARHLGPEVFLIEYGSGSSLKTRVLLDALVDPVAYVPIDISRDALFSSAEAIAKQYPELTVLPQCADYLASLSLPHSTRTFRRRIVYFPGSTIGNFVPSDAVDFLTRMAHQVGAGGGVLIGLDLKKDTATLERAYDDERGVTAAFNMNLLVRLNRELDANFLASQFRHEARWNALEGRIEMHLVCTEACRVTLGGEVISFASGESIHTENSYKYESDEFDTLASRAGLTPRTDWTDAEHSFSVKLFEVDTKNGNT